MNKYLLIDNTPTANKHLIAALLGGDGADFVSTTDPEDIKRFLILGNVKAVFVRMKLWDHTWFKSARENGTMPELVLLGKAEQQITGCCGVGMPHFLADDASVEDVNGVFKHINSPFLQAMDFKFILVKGKGEYVKVDLAEISKLESDGHSTVLETSCGSYILRKPLRDIVMMMTEAGFGYTDVNVMERRKVTV